MITESEAKVAKQAIIENLLDQFNKFLDYVKDRAGYLQQVYAPSKPSIRLIQDLKEIKTYSELALIVIDMLTSLEGSEA